MANVVDKTQDLTINLILEGFATIVSFTADKTSAHPGENVTVNYMLRNDGDTTDTLFGKIIDLDTGAEIASTTFTNVGVGLTVTDAGIFVMPARVVRLRLSAGHVQ